MTAATFKRSWALRRSIVSSRAPRILQNTPAEEAAFPELVASLHALVPLQGQHLGRRSQWARQAVVRPSDAPALTPETATVEAVETIARANVPGWSSLPPGGLSTEENTVGLSNRNFKMTPVTSSRLSHMAALFRVYGDSKSDLNDIDFELRMVKLLSDYNVGPRIFAEGDGWRVEEWHESCVLPNSRMRNPSILAQVAAALARMHKLSRRVDFPQDIASGHPLSLQRLVKWGEVCRSESARQLSRPGLDVDEINAERMYVSELVEESSAQPGCGVDHVFSHWDPQENNILETAYGIRFIDFEYSGMDFQAFDLASYFQECTIDYLVEEKPYYSIDETQYPTLAERRFFCFIYLSEYLGDAIDNEDPAIDALLRTVERFTLATNYIWTVWSLIRKQSHKGDFCYLTYAQSRWQMYLRAKERIERLYTCRRHA